MRNLLWRGFAVALAACIGFILWHWPAEPVPVEFVLEPDCNAGIPIEIGTAGSFACWENGKRVEFREMESSPERAAQILKIRAHREEAQRPLAEDERCISGQRFYRIKNGWAQVGECQEPVSR